MAISDFSRIARRNSKMSNDDKVFLVSLVVLTVCFMLVWSVITITANISREKTCEYAGYANHVKIDNVRYCYRYNEGQIELLKFELVERYNK